MTDRPCGLVLPIEIQIVIADVVAQIQAGYELIQVHRSTNGEGGIYVEITTESTRVELISTQTTYFYTDQEGSPDYWYKFRLYNPTTQAVTAFSSPQPGELDPALSVCSIGELKTNYLFGLDLTDDQGNPYPDSLYAHYIKSAVKSVETKLDIPLIPTVIEEERQSRW
jgi:hypothetical protein